MSLVALFCLPAVASAAKGHHVGHVRVHAARHHRRRHKHHKRVHPSTDGTSHRASTGRPATAANLCQGANLEPTAENLESVRAATLCLINGERARYGEEALVVNAQLTDAAAAHSNDMVAHDYFEHTSPGGQTMLMRIRASGFIPNNGDGYELGENIAWGTLWYSTPRSIVEAWMASPGHRANILDGSYRDTGIGVVPAVPSSLSEGESGGIYTQDFGTIIFP
jgi:uncharacterized protein YkwD